MKNYQNSDYAFNKYSSGIVYRFANQTVEVTLEGYLRENPDKTEVDFIELKVMSDEIYLEQTRKENRHTYRNVSLYSLEENDACAVPSPEDELIRRLEQANRQKRQRELAKRVWDKFTDVQQQRYVLHNIRGLSTRKIAKLENVNQSKIVKSLAAAEKKIKKALIAS